MCCFQFYVLRIGEKQVARTLISHGVRELSDSLLSLIARQMKITPVQLKKIVSGEIGRTDYYHLLGIENSNDE